MMVIIIAKECENREICENYFKQKPQKPFLKVFALCAFVLLLSRIWS